jgi:hypothetical protein
MPRTLLLVRVRSRERTQIWLNLIESTGVDSRPLRDSDLTAWSGGHGSMRLGDLGREDRPKMAVALEARCSSMLFRAFSSSAGGSPASMTTAAYPFLTIPSLVCTTSAVRAGLPAGVPHRRSDTVAAQPEKAVDKVDLALHLQQLPFRCIS